MNTVKSLSANQERVSWRTWFAVVVLGLSSFAIVTTELAPIGLLSPWAFRSTSSARYCWFLVSQASSAISFQGNWLTGLVLASLALMAASVLALGNVPIGGSAFIVGALLLGWGVGVAIVFVGLQTWILRLAGQAAMPASAIYVAIFNAAIGAGALLGGLVLSMTTLSELMVIAAIAIAASLIPVMLIKPTTS